MKVKVFIQSGYKIVAVNILDDIKKIAEKFDRWEYVL